MTPNSEVAVTLSEKMLGHMRVRATALRIPLKWLVAGLVCDTIERFADVHPSKTASTPRVGRTTSRHAEA